MTNKQKYFSILVAVFTLFNFLVVPSALAQYTPSQGTPSSNLLIDKKIFNPQTKQYVDNLNRDQYLFTPDQVVGFQLVVTNTGNQDLNTLDITDQLPVELSYVSGGSLDKGGQPHFYVNKLTPGQSQTLYLQAKVNINQKLTGIVCPVNLGQAQTGSLLDQDTSTFCIQQNIAKQMPPVEELPKTGLPLIAWGLAGLLPIGLKLRKTGNQGQNSESALFTWQKREFRKES